VRAPVWSRDCVYKLRIAFTVGVAPADDILHAGGSTTTGSNCVARCMPGRRRHVTDVATYVMTTITPLIMCPRRAEICTLSPPPSETYGLDLITEIRSYNNTVN